MKLAPDSAGKCTVRPQPCSTAGGGRSRRRVAGSTTSSHPKRAHRCRHRSPPPRPRFTTARCARGSPDSSTRAVSSSRRSPPRSASRGEARADAPLRWKFKAGETVHYSLIQKTETSMKLADGQTGGSKVSQNSDIRWTVKNVSAEGVAETDPDHRPGPVRMDSGTGPAAVRVRLRLEGAAAGRRDGDPTRARVQGAGGTQMHADDGRCAARSATSRSPTRGQSLKRASRGASATCSRKSR